MSFTEIFGNKVIAYPILSFLDPQSLETFKLCQKKISALVRAFLKQYPLFCLSSAISHKYNFYLCRHFTFPQTGVRLGLVNPLIYVTKVGIFPRKQTIFYHFQHEELRVIKGMPNPSGFIEIQNLTLSSTSKPQSFSYCRLEYTDNCFDFPQWSIGMAFFNEVNEKWQYVTLQKLDDPPPRNSHPITLVNDTTARILFPREKQIRLIKKKGAWSVRSTKQTCFITWKKEGEVIYGLSKRQLFCQIGNKFVSVFRNRKMCFQGLAVDKGYGVICSRQKLLILSLRDYSVKKTIFLPLDPLPLLKTRGILLRLEFQFPSLIAQFERITYVYPQVLTLEIFFPFFTHRGSYITLLPPNQVLILSKSSLRIFRLGKEPLAIRNERLEKKKDCLIS